METGIVAPSLCPYPQERGAPGLAWPPNLQPPQVVSPAYTWASWAPAWCRPGLTEQLGRGGESLRGQLVLVAVMSPWHLSCELPAPPGPPSLAPPLARALSCRLMGSYCPSSWTVGLGSHSHLQLLGHPVAPPVSFPRAKVLGPELFPPDTTCLAPPIAPQPPLRPQTGQQRAARARHTQQPPWRAGSQGLGEVWGSDSMGQAALTTYCFFFGET